MPEAPDDVPEAEPLPLAVPLVAFPVVAIPVVAIPVLAVPVVAPAVLPVVTPLPVPPAVPLFDVETPDPSSPEAEPVPAALPLLAFSGDVEHADSATTPAIPTDALSHFMVIFALCLKNENGLPA
jgi:hypothetical protein